MDFLPHKTEEELRALIIKHLTESSFGIQVDSLRRFNAVKVYIQCIVCRQPKIARYSGLLKKQGLTCSKECNHALRSFSQKQRGATESVEIKTKRVEALRKKYEDQEWVEKVLAKRKETCLVEKGVEHYSKDPTVRNKISKGVKEAYNDGTVLKQRFATNTTRYGHRNFLASTSGQAIIIASNQTRLGVDFPFQNPEYQQATKAIAQKVLLEKYGVDNAAKNPVLLAKRVKSFHHNRFRDGKNYPKEFWLGQTYGYNCTIDPKQELPQAWGKGSNLQLQIICGMCNNRWSPVWNDITSGRTQTCGCKVGTSVAEIRVFEYVSSLCPDTLHRYKIGKLEADIFVPSKNIAIEYNGLFFHRADIYGMKDAEKAKKFREIGIRYIGIFEDEWLQKESMVKNYLAMVCGEKKKVRQLRPQQVKIIFSKNNAQIKTFLQEYHYGGGNAILSEVWCIFDGSTLIGVFGCGAPTRSQIKEDIELKRVCLHSDYHIPGLWSYIIKNYVTKFYPKGTMITSFSDNRRDTGNLYKAIGFTEIAQVRPDYYWCKGQQRFHKARFQKVTKIQDELTENEYMVSQGYHKIYDCGKTKWSLVI